MYHVHMMPASRLVRSYRRPFLHILMIGPVVKTKRRKEKKVQYYAVVQRRSPVNVTNIHKLQ